MNTLRNTAFGLALGAVVLAYGVAANTGHATAQTPAPTPGPFANNNGITPPPDYKGPTFALNFPASMPPTNTHRPWRAVSPGYLTASNAGAYVRALKHYVTPAMRNLVAHYDRWDAKKYGWYNQPWVGENREAIHGLFQSVSEDPQQFGGTGLTYLQGFVIEYYDTTAARTLYNFWGTSALKPKYDSTQAAQFAEGAVIIKAAAGTAMGPDGKLGWAPLDGAAMWDALYFPTVDGAPATPAPYTVFRYPVFQFDIIVKDSIAAPKTGWVFSTLVYDRNAAGADPWDKMVPLGASWGNDPQAGPDHNRLRENWINPNAPAWSKMTLGWGGRLSGPNDGAVSHMAIGGATIAQQPNSSCMSCHASADITWPANRSSPAVAYAITPATPAAAPTTIAISYPPATAIPAPFGYQVAPAIGSKLWMDFFQDRPGTQPQTPGAVSYDFDLMFVENSLPNWACGVRNVQLCPPQSSAMALLGGARSPNAFFNSRAVHRANLTRHVPLRTYNGRPQPQP